MQILSVSSRTYKLILKIQKEMSKDGEWITEDDVIYELIEKAQKYDVIQKENRSLNRKLTKKEKFTENIATSLAETKSEPQQLIMPSMQYNQALIPQIPLSPPPRPNKIYFPKSIDKEDNSPAANKLRLKNEVNKVFDGTIKSPSDIMNECEPSHLGVKVIEIEGEIELLSVSEEEKGKKSNYI